MAGSTQPGARTAGLKYQAGHGFRRGQPVYLESQGRYALASLDTGFDGVVGATALQTFELVTNGEVDALTGLVPNTVYSLTATPGVLAPGTDYPVYKALAADTASLVSANVGTTGTDVVLPYTFSVTPIPNGVPIAGADGKLDSGWIPALDYEVIGTAETLLATHVADPSAHAFYVRNPEGGGVLDLDDASLVFDMDVLTQVVDEAFL